MTTDVLLVFLIAAVMVPGMLIATVVKQAGGNIHNSIDRHREAVEGLRQDVSAGLTRIGVAADKIADERPAQKSAQHYQDMSEGLLLGINAVLEMNIEHPEGLKDDVVVGREQGAALIKDTLQTELNKALN